MGDYQVDGVAVLRGVLDEVPLDILRWAIDTAQAKPSPMSRNLAENGATFWNDFSTWRRNPYISWLAKSLAPACAAATGNQSLRLFHDHVIVKSGDSPETPWHMDAPYYCVTGPNNFTIWMSPDDVDVEESLWFIPESHRSDKTYVPVNFKDGSVMDGGGDMTVLDEAEIDRLVAEHGAVGYGVTRGDAIIFDNRMVHMARRSQSPIPRSSLSIRYLGEGATLTHKAVNPTPPYPKMGMRFNEGDEPQDAWMPVVYP